jgi:ComF family protein
MWLKIMIRALFDAVFPPRCLICNTYYCGWRSKSEVSSDAVSHLTASFFCGSCQDLPRIVSPFCPKCGLPFVSREGEDHTCSECLTRERYFRKARAFGAYDGNLMTAIHRLKYGKKPALARPLGELVRRTFFRFWNREDVDLIVPVPLHIKRLRERGFNQTYLLVRRWAKQDGIPLDGLALCRDRYTAPQTLLSRAARKKNIRGAFSVRRPERVRGRKILLVDDVYTTGATVNECARVLTRAGAASVDVLTLARAA